MIPPALRSAFAEYRPLVSIGKRALVLFGIVFGFVTVLPDTASGWLHPPNVFLGWVKDSFAVTVLVAMERSLLPHGIVLIVIGPFDAFTAIMEMGFYIAFAATAPYLVWGFIRWLVPGLTKREARTVRWIASFSAVLFFAGMAFTYLVLLPPIYQFSYSLQPVVGAMGTISLESFVETTFLFLISVGLAFELPPVCLGLSYAGLLSAETMGKNWNWAYAGFWVVAFLISPGVGGGIIEGGIATILFGLYMLSYVLIKRMETYRKWRIPSYA